MSNPTLTSCVLAAPIERIRGGAIVVSLTCTFQVEGQTFLVSGVATSQKDDESAILEARQRAIQDAINQIPNMGIEVISNTTPKEVVGLLRQFAETEVSRVVEEKRASGNTAQADKLDGPATPKVQQEISSLCESIGIASIPVLDENEPFTLGMAIALKTELDKRVKRFTAGNEGLEGRFRKV